MPQIIQKGRCMQEFPSESSFSTYRMTPCCIAHCLQAEGASRDVLLLDIALDGYFRLCVERMDKAALSGDDLVNLTGLVLSNAVIANDSRDLQQVPDR